MSKLRRHGFIRNFDGVLALTEGFQGHRGRKGKRGGSMPKSAGPAANIGITKPVGAPAALDKYPRNEQGKFTQSGPAEEPTAPAGHPRTSLGKFSGRRKGAVDSRGIPLEKGDLVMVSDPESVHGGPSKWSGFFLQPYGDDEVMVDKSLGDGSKSWPHVVKSSDVVRTPTADEVGGEKDKPRGRKPVTTDSIVDSYKRRVKGWRVLRREEGNGWLEVTYVPQGDYVMGSSIRFRYDDGKVTEIVEGNRRKFKVDR